MALSKVTFFDNTNFTLDNRITEKCKDFVSIDGTSSLADAGIYFTPKYDENEKDINKVHHIAHNGHIYTLGSDVIEDNSSYYSYYDCEINDTNTSISIISSLEANTFEKTIKYTSLNIDFSDILNRLSELENTVKLLRYGPVIPTVAPNKFPRITLYYIKYNIDGRIANVYPVDLSPYKYEYNNVNKILISKKDFDEFITDNYFDNANYILRDDKGDPITRTINNTTYDVICIGIFNNYEEYIITNICLPDEHNNRYGREITIDDNNLITLPNSGLQVIKIGDAQNTNIRISAIVYDKKIIH